MLEAGGEAVACGGWSRRDRLYTGSGDAVGDARELDPATEPARVRAMFVRDDWTRRGLGRRILEECEAAARREGFRTLSLMATLPGVPLYLAYGFRAARRGRRGASGRSRAPVRLDGEADRLVPQRLDLQAAAADVSSDVAHAAAPATSARRTPLSTISASPAATVRGSPSSVSVALPSSTT